MTTPPIPRLLPSTDPDGKPGYLLTDRNDSYVARYADGVEALQLGMCVGLLAHARAMIGDPAVDAPQLRFLAEQLSAALADAVRIAELRGRCGAG
ncbi:hypothetical protein [Streptomyces sirii]|uniref:hypothetical protein n=1 Tax=Streptomyces sirii TaxID=3127701 RepID=UPI003D35D9B5